MSKRTRSFLLIGSFAAIATIVIVGVMLLAPKAIAGTTTTTTETVNGEILTVETTTIVDCNESGEEPCVESTTVCTTTYCVPRIWLSGPTCSTTYP